MMSDRATRADGRTDSASRLIKATPAAIYQAFLDPNALVRWLPPSGMTACIDVFDPREGGEYQLTLTYDRPDHSAPGKTTEHADVTRGRFLQLLSSRQIVQSVRFDSVDPKFAGEMRTTWLLEPDPEGSIVTITAENVPVGITSEEHEAGFASTLANLAAFVEGTFRR